MAANDDTPYVEAFRQCVIVAALARARSNGDTETVAWLEARMLGYIDGSPVRGEAK